MPAAGKTSSDFPLMEEDCPELDSPIIYHAMVGQLPLTLGNNFTDAIGSNSLEQCGGITSGLEPPCAGPQSIIQTQLLIKELKDENYKDPILDRTNFPSNKDVPHMRRGQWPHLSQLLGGPKHKGFLGDPLSRAKDKLMVSVRENSRRDDVNTWHQRHLTHPIDKSGQVSIDDKDGNNLNSESALLPQDARTKILSTSSFSHFFGKKIPKGKGVIYEHPVDNTQVGNCGTLQSNTRPFSSVGITPGAQRQLLQNCSSEVAFASNRAGVILREWLKPGRCTRGKVEGLNFFCQIAELVNLAHSQGVVLQQLRPSYFILMPSKKLKYIGSSTQKHLEASVFSSGCKKRAPEEDINFFCTSDVKQQKLITALKSQNQLCSTTSISGARTTTLQDINDYSGCSSSSINSEHKLLSKAPGIEKSLPADLHLEEKWYACPEELDGKGYKFPSNVYSLGLLLFELLCSFDSLEAHSAAMFDFQHRILPPSFLSESPKEAGFCLWLTHPDPSSRPTIREILLSDQFCRFQELQSSQELTMFGNDEELVDSEILLDFLVSLKEKKQDHTTKLVENIKCIEADIERFGRNSLSTTSVVPLKREYSLEDLLVSVAREVKTEARSFNDMCQLEKAYFSSRSQTTVATAVSRADRDFLKNRETWSQVQKQNEMVSMNQTSAAGLGDFFEGLCKYTCFSKFELCGTLRNGDPLNSANVICSLSFDRDEEYIAVAGASKKIKIFEFSALLNDNIGIHYPAIEMGNKSKLSCVSWNSYIKNYLASTDYDGMVQVWDAGTGMVYSQHIEHQKRAWSVDFSRVDPTKFASGSDDRSVKLWSMNDKKSTCTIWSPANVCCVQFSPYSSHLLALGSADHKIYGYDLRHTRIPWCLLSGHGKTVSYVKFLDPETLVSASTDNTLKLWDLSKTNLSGISSDACHVTFSGHANKKHFVGLSVCNGYIACGSESNEVFTYYKSLPMPITSYKFTPMGPTARHDLVEDNSPFVSSVCWRSKSNMVLAANSGGSIRLLQLV